MDLSKLMLLPLGFIALVGACVPYPVDNYGRPVQPEAGPDNQQNITDEEQRQLDESRARLKRQKEQQANNNQSSGNNNSTASKPTKPKKPNYPTASAVPGKSGFVFNPYTHSIVDVKGIGSGKLVKDPDDNDPTHKFRVP